jgi:flagellar hook-associated protein 1 FlgK
MSSLLSIMDTSLSAMWAARVAIQTVGHNIANASTPGFSRQEVMLGARQPLVLPYGSLGRGVNVLGIRRATDEFLLANHRAQTSRLASYTEVDSALQEIEAILGSVDNDHLGNAISEFFGAWSDLATPQAEPALKTAVLSAARNLVADFHAIDSSLDELEQNLESTLEGAVDEFNGLLQQIADLNQEIMSAQANGTPANDLHDQRDNLLLELSQMTRLTSVERDDGTLDVIIEGRTMVTRTHAEQIDRRWVDTGDGWDLSLVTASTRRPVALGEGQLSGFLQARDEQVRQVREGLDELAALLAEKVNAIHQQGHSGGSTGLSFFSGSSARDLEINPPLLEDSDLVATSRSGLAGDNDVALEIAALADLPLGGEGGRSLNDRYRGLVTDIASQRSRYEFLLESQTNIVGAVEMRLDAIRGVSLDEEGANLVRYQNAYDASARVISTVQDMFDSLMEMI